jgi:hypothetical protein
MVDHFRVWPRLAGCSSLQEPSPALMSNMSRPAPAVPAERLRRPAA